MTTAVTQRPDLEVARLADAVYTTCSLNDSVDRDSQTSNVARRADTGEAK